MAVIYKLYLTNEDKLMKPTYVANRIRLNIWTDSELYAAVKAMAKDNNRSMAGQIREALVQAVAAHRAKTGGVV